MNYKAKEEQLVKEFNQNQRNLVALKQQSDALQTRQIQIQGQLLLIKELNEEALKKKDDIQHKAGKKHKR